MSKNISIIGVLYYGMLVLDPYQIKAYRSHMVLLLSVDEVIVGILDCIQLHAQMNYKNR